MSRKFLRVCRKYAAVAGQAARNHLAYPKDLLGRALFLGLILFVYNQVWGKALGAGGAFGGFTRAQLTWYMAFTEGIALSFPRLQGTVSEDVKTGNIAYRLNKPLSYLGQLLGQYLGEAAVNAAVTLSAAVAAAFLLAGPWPGFAPGAAAAVLAAVAGGTVLSFFLTAALALSAFWVEDNGPFFWLYSKINFVLGGLLIPVEVYPGLLRRITEYLPFRLVFAGPARLLVRFDRRVLGEILAAQSLWLPIFIALTAMLYRLGVRKLNVNGG
ncbi:MAG: ABC transporter permease [Bacteroidota bacterium]